MLVNCCLSYIHRVLVPGTIEISNQKLIPAPKMVKVLRAELQYIEPFGFKAPNQPLGQTLSIVSLVPPFIYRFKVKIIVVD